MQIVINVEGMTCANCANGIKKQLEKKGIQNVNVNFTTGELSCNQDKNQDKKTIEKLIKELGYTIKESNNKKNSLSKVERYFFVTLLFTIPLISHMFLEKNSPLHNPLLQFTLCLPVYIIGILYFGKSAWNSIKISIPNMDVLIFTGSSAAFFYSIYGWLINYGTDKVHQYLFFETSATIITLVLLGNLLEYRSVKKTTTAISDLSAIQKVVAKKEVDKKIVEVNYEEIKVNDILIINAGDKVPADGVIISGSCYVDESMITGESIPVNKEEKSEVIGGTIIIEGSLKIRATKVGNDTLLSQIIELVKNAQNNKPRIQKIGDQVSAIFVPAVLIISISTYFISHYFFNVEIQDAFLRSIAVLVISCPCAMGLATPTAVMVGIGRAAKNGILIKGGNTLEKLASISHLVFDKTGTLTTGNFIVSELNIIKGDKNEIKNIIYNLEKHSSHPIAKSLCKVFASNNKTLKLNNIKEKKGISISAIIEGDTYMIGSSKIIKSDLNHDLFLLKNKELIASLKINDELKNGTVDVFKKLKRYQKTLLSGDKENKCNIIASALQIDTVFSQQLPNEKIKKIESFVNKKATAMIGDGIKDAPALEKATVGISLANATEIAIQSADVILLNNENLEQLPKVLLIGKHTLLTIKQNLFWAFSYNIIAIPIAIAGLLNPMWGALFMAFSDIVVIGNSIRLRFKKIF